MSNPDVWRQSESVGPDPADRSGDLRLQSGGEPLLRPDGRGCRGHFVHNGIQYADRQLISKRYDQMRVAE